MLQRGRERERTGLAVYRYNLRNAAVRTSPLPCEARDVAADSWDRRRFVNVDLAHRSRCHRGGSHMLTQARELRERAASFRYPR